MPSAFSMVAGQLTTAELSRGSIHAAAQATLLRAVSSRRRPQPARIRPVRTAEPPLSAERAVFMEAFMESYGQLPRETLGLASLDALPGFLNEAFDDEVAAYRLCADVPEWEQPHRFYRALCGSTVVGYLSVDVDVGEEKTGYLRQMAVSPSFQKQGVAHSLVAKAMEDADHVCEWTVSYRKFNTRAEDFYRSLGFKAVESCHSTLDPNKYQGMVFRKVKE